MSYSKDNARFLFSENCILIYNEFNFVLGDAKDQGLGPGIVVHIYTLNSVYKV